MECRRRVVIEPETAQKQKRLLTGRDVLRVLQGQRNDESETHGDSAG